MNDYRYDATYDPPIPVCNVTLIAPATNQRADLTAIVDTGADGTIRANSHRPAKSGSCGSERTAPGPRFLIPAQGEDWSGWMLEQRFQSCPQNGCVLVGESAQVGNAIHRHRQRIWTRIHTGLHGFGQKSSRIRVYPWKSVSYS